MVGKLERVPLREVWKQETDYTRWLQENVDVLNDVLDLSLSGAEREQSAGAFSVDLIAEDEAGNPVIIENQLEKTNHDHLGKLITYLTAIEARAAIWVAADPRPEHVRAISWLNESSPASFYLVKVEAIRIADSPPAPLFTLIVGPSEEGRDVGETKKELAERHIIRRRFWQELLASALSKTKLHARISPSHDNWISTSAGQRGLALSYVIRQHAVSVELYIDRGKGAEDENRAIFDSLAASKDAIEADFGDALEWQRLEGRRACRITKLIEVGGYRDETRWPIIQDAMIDAMIRLEKAVAPYVKRLAI